MSRNAATTSPPPPTASADFSLAVSASSLSATAGQSATDSVSVAAQNGFTGAVTLSVSGLPTGATATFSPATVSGLAELWRLRPDPAVLEGRLGAPQVAHDGEVTMKLDQVTIHWGPPEDNTKKWQVVQALIGQEAVDPQGAAPLTMNLRNPDAPVVSGLPEPDTNTGGCGF